MPRRAPPEQHGVGDGAHRHQVGQHVELLGFQRGDAPIPVDDPHRDRHHVGERPAHEQRLDRGAEVADERGVAHVTEVDDAGDPPALVDERVVHRDVAVDHLRPERRPPRHAPTSRTDRARLRAATGGPGRRSRRASAASPPRGARPTGARDPPTDGRTTASRDRGAPPSPRSRTRPRRRSPEDRSKRDPACAHTHERDARARPDPQRWSRTRSARSAGSSPASGSGAATGRVGSTANTWSAAAVSMSMTARSSLALEILRTPDRPVGTSDHEPLVSLAPHRRGRAAQVEQRRGNRCRVLGAERGRLPPQHISIDRDVGHRLDAIGPSPDIVSLPTDAPLSGRPRRLLGSSRTPGSRPMEGEPCEASSVRQPPCAWRCSCCRSPHPSPAPGRPAAPAPASRVTARSRARPATWRATRCERPATTS